MTVPARREAARLLLSLDPPAWALRHACAVADVAAWLAGRASSRGLALDRRAVEAAALLHDVDKLPSLRPDRRLPHGEGSAAWLTAHGLEELAPLVRDHPVTRLADDALAARLAAAPLEARLVAYADKRAGQRLETMDERFGSWQRRYPSGPGEHVKGKGGRPTGKGWGDDVATLVVERARELERTVCEALGVAPDEVERLRWSRRALREVAAACAPHEGTPE
jgi:HD domain